MKPKPRPVWISLIAGGLVVSRICAERGQTFFEQMHRAADDNASGPASKKETAELMMFPHLWAMTAVNLLTI